MKRVVFLVLFLAGIVLLANSNKVFAGCAFDNYGVCSGSCSCPSGTTGSCSCVNYYGYACAATYSCVTPVPQPTSPTSCLPPNCGQYDENTYHCYANGQTPVCTQDVQCRNQKWQCTGNNGGCTQWSSWSSCYPAPACIQTKYCLIGNAQPQAQSCTNALGCGSGGPTATPTPIPIPNCMNLSGPSTLTAGQKGTYTADFSSPQGNLSGEIFAGQNGTGVWYPGNKAISGNSGSLSFDWTPTAAGTYDVLCRAWNDAIAECRGKADYVSGPPVYTCAGPNSSMVVTVVAPTATPTPGPYIKLKNSSFVSDNGLKDDIPAVPTAYDADDDGTANFIITQGGIVAAPSINLTTYNASAKPSPGNWSAAYTPAPAAMTPANFLNYLKARKSFTTISDLGSINTNGIYYYNGASPLTLTSVPSQFNSYKVVLVTSGEVDINMSQFNPTQSVALIASTINFSSSVTEADGIFIANAVGTGAGTSGLKIVGNLVVQSTLTQGRSNATTTAPSLFVVFSPQTYLNLLPFMSTANYEWQQLQ